METFFNNTNMINERILTLLDVLGLAGKDAELALGVSKQVISKYKTEDRSPSVDAISYFKTKYPEISLDWIFTGNGKPYMSSGEVTETMQKLKDHELEFMSLDGVLESKIEIYLKKTTHDCESLIKEHKDQVGDITSGLFKRMSELEEQVLVLSKNKNLPKKNKFS